MEAPAIAEELDRIRQWPVEWQIELAEHLNALTWGSQWESLCARIEARAQKDPISDREIDDIVREVREKKPLHRR